MAESVREHPWACLDALPVDRDAIERWVTDQQRTDMR
jgi:hypothetical protein